MVCFNTRVIYALNITIIKFLSNSMRILCMTHLGVFKNQFHTVTHNIVNEYWVIAKGATVYSGCSNIRYNIY